MRKIRKIMNVMMIGVVICSIFLTGCSKNGKDEADNNSEASEIVEEKDYLKMQTSIAYSNGDTKNWTYGNQRKEFPNNESCYVRIGCTAITTGSFGKGNGDTIAVTYRFTGVNNCKVEVSDGKAISVDTNDPNVLEFSHNITAAKEKKASEDVMIFRYSPNGAESVVLEVIYDDQIAEKYDELNTIYFDKISDSQNQVH